MSFFQGRASFLRFRVNGRVPELFGPEQIRQLSERAIGKQKLASADGIEMGWIAGTDILDTAFSLEKNVVEDCLFFALRVDQTKLPGDLLKAYYQADLRALCADNPSGKPSARQKREAKESARDRLEHEAKDGRFLKRKAFECLWDLRSNELLFGATSQTHLDRLAVLFKDTFGAALELMTAGMRAYEVCKQHREIAVAEPSIFTPSTPYMDVAWSLGSRDFLGNEFLLWLWFRCETEGDDFKLADRSFLSLMFSGGIKLECPRGQNGNDTINADGPTRLPEARRAIQAGKLPRKAGLTLVRHDQQYAFHLLAETLGIGSAKFPNSEEESESGRIAERVSRLRDLIQGMDLLYGEFCRIRFGGEWAEVLAAMQGWLDRGERKAA